MVPIVGNWVGSEDYMEIVVMKGKVFVPATDSMLLTHSLVAIVTKFCPHLCMMWCT
jgi:hypothetical protein